MFSGVGALPKPATESHVVNRGTPVAPCRLKAQRKRVTRVGSPLQSSFPKYHELFEEPHHCKAADNSPTAKASRFFPHSLLPNVCHGQPNSLRVCQRDVQCGVLQGALSSGYFFSLFLSPPLAVSRRLAFYPIAGATNERVLVE